jgi:outer membrane protein assembly complex protein YaeT
MRRALSAVFLVLLSLVSGACKEEGTIKVHSLKFQGVKSVDVSRLKNALATRESSKLPWGKKNYFDRSRFDADLKRIQAFYADRGFPDARVTGFDVKLNDKQDAVDATLTIVEGEAVKVAAINFTGFDVIPPAHLADLEKQIPLKVGQPRDRQLVVATHEMALNELRDHGFPFAKVGTNEDDGSNGKSATLTFDADPGPIAHFGPVDITGNKSVSDRVIRRELAYKPGDLYQRSLIQDTQRRLYSMELFQFATVEPIMRDGAARDGTQPANAPQPPDLQNPVEVPTRVTVAEGNHQRVNFGVGYGTEEKGRVDAEYHHLNFFGGARTAGAHARWSSLDRGLRLDFNQPYVFRPHFSLGLEGQQWYTYTPAYKSVTSGGKATLTHRSSAKTSWAVSITSEYDKSVLNPDLVNSLDYLKYLNDLIALGLDPFKLEQAGTLNAAGFDFQHSTADNLLNAHHGFQIGFHAEEAGKLLPGTYNYLALSADGRHYLPIAGDKVVWANRLQIGNIRAPGGDERLIPFSRRYFLGGASSLRGWGRYEVSPLSGSGLPVGGTSMLAFTSELRTMLTGNLGGVLFLDGGNVWISSFAQNLSGLRWDVGPGLRYQTPIGPIRFDFGYQLNPIPGLIVNGQPETRHWRIHFSIGQAF